MNYFKRQNDVFAFNDEEVELGWVEADMIAMSDDEVERHRFPEKFLNAAEKREKYLKSLKPLTRRQFKLILLKHDLLDKVSEGLAKIEDKTLRMQAQIEFEDSTMFDRLNPTLLMLYKAMGISESKLDSMWEEGLKL